jgi:hypothetical protein
MHNEHIEQLNIALKSIGAKCPPVIRSIIEEVLEESDSDEFTQGALTLLVNLLEAAEADGDILFQDNV